MKHEVIIYRSPEDNVLVAEVPELPGRTADGRTQQQALKAVERVANAWIAVARELGRPIPRPRGTKVMCA